ncbi:MAG: hypothetical protein C4521_07600 [Actinobacteria bacterium]|nr:MAG: hypothetical protein C4521_07600 [Actinomycetota bacterium]
MRKPVKELKELHTETVMMQPISLHWGEISGWMVYPRSDEEEEYEREGPTVNYCYPLPQEFERDHPDAAEASKLLQGLPLCLVEFDPVCHDWGLPKHALALTGGGMNFSWEVCEAYMRLGYLPPYHYTDLPRLAGMKLSARHRWIIAGCRRTCHVLMEQARWQKTELARVTEWCREQS